MSSMKRLEILSCQGLENCMKLLEIVLQCIRCFRMNKNLSSSSLLKRAVPQLTVRVRHEL